MEIISMNEWVDDDDDDEDTKTTVTHEDDEILQQGFLTATAAEGCLIYCCHNDNKLQYKIKMKCILNFS